MAAGSSPVDAFGSGDRRSRRAASAQRRRGLSTLSLHGRGLFGRRPGHDRADGHGDGEAEREAADHVGRPVHAEVHARDGHRHGEDRRDDDHRPAPPRGPGDHRQCGGDGGGGRRVAAREGCARDGDERLACWARAFERHFEERVEDQRHGDAGAEVQGLHHPSRPPEAAEQGGDEDGQEPPGVELVQRLGDGGERLPAVLREEVDDLGVERVQGAAAHEDRHDDEDGEPGGRRDQEQPALPAEAESALSSRHR